MVLFGNPFEEEGVLFEVAVVDAQVEQVDGHSED